MMVLRAVEILSRSNHRARTKTPVFHDLLTIIWNSGITIKAQAMKFAMGTSGYVGSIVMDKLKQVLKEIVTLK